MENISKQLPKGKLDIDLIKQAILAFSKARMINSA